MLTGGVLFGCGSARDEFGMGPVSSVRDDIDTVIVRLFRGGNPNRLTDAIISQWDSTGVAMPQGETKAGSR